MSSSTADRALRLVPESGCILFLGAGIHAPPHEMSPLAYPTSSELRSARP